MALRNRLTGIVIGLAIAAAVLLWQSKWSAGVQWDLLPENEGTISTAAIQYTCATAPATRPCYQAFLKQLGPDAEVVVVCGDKQDEGAFVRDVRSWGIAHPERLKTVVVGRPITGWCKDRFLVTTSNPAKLVHPKPADAGVAARNYDSLVAPTIAKTFPKRFKDLSVPLEFDSGDIVSTRDCVIVCDTLSRKNEGVADLDSRLARLTARRVIHLIGVPDHHIGMFAAPLDGKTVLVGDVKLAKHAWTPQLDKTVGHADFSSKVAALFDQAAKQLARQGFRVVRIPTVYLAPQVYVSYTNGVFETRGKEKIVYMPKYEIHSLDSAARKVYESLGWQVRSIPVRTVFHYRGTIGCLVNVLQRG